MGEKLDGKCLRDRKQLQQQALRKINAVLAHWLRVLPTVRAGKARL